MKRIAYLVVLALLCSGATCRNVDGLRHTEITSKAVTYATIATLLQRQPEHIVKVTMVRDRLSTLLASDSFTPEALATVVAGLPVSSMHEGNTRIIITTLLLIYEDFGVEVDVDKTPIMRAVAMGILDGLNMALTGAERRRSAGPVQSEFSFWRVYDPPGVWPQPRNVVDLQYWSYDTMGRAVGRSNIYVYPMVTNVITPGMWKQWKMETR